MTNASKLFDSTNVHYTTSDRKYHGCIDDKQLAVAKHVAEQRQQEAVKAGLPDRHGFKGDGRSIHILGAIGELVVTEALGLKWSESVNTFKAPDILDCVQVRTRSTGHYGNAAADLLIRPNDKDDEFFVHVTADLESEPISFTIHGYILARDGKSPQWLKRYGNRPAAYFVPASILEPLRL